MANDTKRETNVAEITKIFPDIDTDFLREKLNAEYQKGLQDTVLMDQLVNEFMDHGYTHKKEPIPIPEPVVAVVIDYEDVTNATSREYVDICITYLANTFSLLPMDLIRATVSKHNGHLTPSKLLLEKKLEQAKSGNGKLLKHPRPQRSMPNFSCDEFFEEVNYLKGIDTKKQQEEDEKFALSLNEKEYQSNGQLIECGCCYGESAFDVMIQCGDGHLFCTECLKLYVEETVLGQGKLEIHCISPDGCKAQFPRSQLERAIPEKTLNQIYTMIQDLEVKTAAIENLESCPFCDFKAIIEKTEKEFSCLNPSCTITSCRKCKLQGHLPKTCEEVIKHRETLFRTTVEEKMSETRIRECAKCKQRYFKIEGCNKINCQCGSIMCYICRSIIVGYDHFCPHERNPQDIFGKCPQCKKCYLFLKNTEATDLKVVDEIQKKSELEHRETNPQGTQVTQDMDDPIQALKRKIIFSEENLQIKKRKTSA